jgi:signal peptide peptidase SppA
MSKLNRIAAAVFAEPWLITPPQHAVIRGIVEAHITGAAHAAGGCAVAYQDVEKDKAAPLYRIVEGNVAVVPIMGTLAMRAGSLEKSSGVADFLDIQNAVEAAANDENIEGMILHIDSPGGTVNGTPETAEYIRSVADKLPMVAYTDGGMNSAAYWIGSQAEVIIASKSAYVGSIGVYMSMLDDSAYYQMNGLKRELFASGKYKGMGISGLPLSEDQRSMLQAQVNAIFADFRSAVLEQRPGVPDEAMQGQSMRAAEARGFGLVDYIGGFDVAIEQVKELAERKKEMGK